jgi:uncharacterized damage-inducible protein DinB
MPGSEVVGNGLAAYFIMIQGRIHELTEPLSTEQLWTKPYRYGNSIGNLILHITGNLNYFIGAQIAQTGYVRHRDQEFSGSGKPKAELLSALDQAIEMAVATISQQAADDWSAPYSADRTEHKDRFSMVLKCAGHADHHVGQMIYLQRELLENA